MLRVSFFTKTLNTRHWNDNTIKHNHSNTYINNTQLIKSCALPSSTIQIYPNLMPFHHVIISSPSCGNIAIKLDADMASCREAVGQFRWKDPKGHCQGNPSCPPPKLPPPRNKALIKPYEGKWMVNSPLIRPYFLGGWHWGGTLIFPWHWVWFVPKGGFCWCYQGVEFQRNNPLKHCMLRMICARVRVLGQWDLDWQSEDAINNIL